jgi:hypothetical protein
MHDRPPPSAARRRRSAARLFVTASLLALAACEAGRPGASSTPRPSTGASPTPAKANCSAGSVPAEVVAQKLPEPVARLREDIASAAAACDYARLERLALGGEPGFTFSFGGGTSAAAFWEEAESTGADEPMGLLIATLNLPFAISEREAAAGAPDRMYVWPSAHREGATDEDWRAVEDLYGQQEIAQMRQQGSGFLGYRVGISEDGDWLFYVAGD